MQGQVPKVVSLGQSHTPHPTSEQLLRVLETMAGVGFCTLSFADGKVQASEGLHVLAGTTDQIGQPISLEFIEARTHPDDRADLVESFHMLMRDLLPMRRELRLVREDGTVKQLDLRFERLVDDAKRPIGWIICALDRTQEESLRKAMSMMRRRLQAVFERLDVDIAWFSSLDGKFLELIRMSEDLGLPKTPIFTLESWFNSVHPDDRQIVLDALGRQDIHTGEVRVEIAPGEYVPMRNVRYPVPDENGQPVEWLGLTSITRPGHGGVIAEDVASEELLNGPLLRGARNLLGWTIPVLAEQSGISASTIMRIEEATAPVIEVARRRTAERLTRALTDGGLIFHRTLTGKLAISL